MEYRRYQGKSYMVCSTEESGCGYETFMLTENSIPGILPVHAANADDRLQFWYDISGRQALEDWIKIKETGSDFLQKLLTALAEAVVHAGEYLLSEDGISLQPGHIFVDPGKQEIAFCYLPFGKRAFWEALQGFLEYYLSHMEHSDREGAQKCYDVYERCRQGYADLEELLSILCRRTERKEGVLQEQKAAAEQKAAKQAAGLPHAGTVSRESKDKKKHAFWRKSKWSKTRLPQVFSEAKRSFAAGSTYEPREYPKESANPTVFLGSETDRTFGELKYEGEGIGTNFPITADVYLIGSQEGEVDGIIPDQTVSRIHARITKEEDGFYLEDMNSTNGTYCNGEPLNYRERVQLHKNDRIAFAQVCYRFV